MRSAVRAVHIHLPNFGPELEDAVIREFAAVYPGHDWFFVRYWLGGPHVRIRTVDSGDAVELLALARQAFDSIVPQGNPELDQDAYLDAVRDLATAGEGGIAIDPGDLRPAGVYPAPYVPEYERYGGAAGFDTITRVFTHSSAIALRALAHDAVTPNIRMNAALLYVLRVMSDYAREFGREEACALAEAGRAFWHRQLSGERAGSGARVPVSESAVAKAAGLVRDLRAAGPGAFDVLAPGPADITELLRGWNPQRRHGILISIIHMHNNRLGCGGRPEYALFHLVSHVMNTGREQ
ncbi:thiopeptide-type bacteriocin biosynthesis domain-containing protein [Nocardia nova SH22a]|uniref:Thiopeptide-type bacteriocin biosynthesis domain-containing protein n=1 Tax=Nocardia nova SH22a TaxID=1415166 RepID=W5TF20_9NOCA|nr:thiopeptide-type bacteriocin biosynthesis protein [Nocardia nova]AHH17905.1 thiopeptide-type bacteriocin biosynthesis domain-containing protein [Nocardia nova SH22a]